MKVLSYLIVVVPGAIGLLSILRVGERLAFGGGQGSVGVQLVVGFVCLLGSWQTLKKARAHELP